MVFACGYPPVILYCMNLSTALSLTCILLAFIRTGQDIKDIRTVLGKEGAHIQIIAKIENRQGLNNFHEILKETDGVMVARGDLGIEIPPSEVFACVPPSSSRNQPGITQDVDHLRGPLAYHSDFWRSAQKKIIALCNIAGKPVICATQMVSLRVAVG